MFKFLKKPTIKAKLVNNGTKVKVLLSNVNAEQVIILLFMVIKQIATSMGIEHSHLINKIIDIDKTIIHAKKVEIKKNKYNK